MENPECPDCGELLEQLGMTQIKGPDHQQVWQGANLWRCSHETTSRYIYIYTLGKFESVYSHSLNVHP